MPIPTYRTSADLFRCGTALTNRNYLSATVGAAVWAGVVREPRLFALWANLQLRDFDLVMLAPEALARIGLAFLWQRAHTLLLILIIAQHAAPRVSHLAPLQRTSAHNCEHQCTCPTAASPGRTMRSGTPDYHYHISSRQILGGCDLTGHQAHRRMSCATSCLLYHRLASAHSPAAKMRRTMQSLPRMWRLLTANHHQRIMPQCSLARGADVEPLCLAILQRGEREVEIADSATRAIPLTCRRAIL